jgi:hypothetical protein
MSGGNQGDSVRVRFINSEGHTLGTWSTTPDRLGIPTRWSWCRREFLPRSDDFVILGVRAPINLDGLRSIPPALRLISPDGRQLWSRDLQSPNCNQLYLSVSGSRIVAYGPIAFVNSGEGALKEHEIQVFDLQGNKVAHVRGHGQWEILRLVIDPSDRLLYYDADTVRAFDLVASQPLADPPEEPLFAVTQSADPASARVADALLHRLREQREQGRAKNGK